MREKMVELIRQIVIPFWAGQIADHLISNDVVPVVRCKDCKHRVDWHEEGYAEDAGMCICTRPVIVALNHYCSYGERKDGDTNAQD